MVVFNPSRRNRNIGTDKQGYGLDNRMVVPTFWGPSWQPYTAKIGMHTTFSRNVSGQDITIIVEETSGGCVHACCLDDIETMLRHVPRSDLNGLATFVLRQSTQKIRTLNPAWGRLYYDASINVGGTTIMKNGPALFLEACVPNRIRKWSTSLDRDDSDELERLRADGHKIDRHGRHFLISSDLKAIRSTQLYRTLLHEIGHWVDWLEKVKAPHYKGGDYEELLDRYFARPQREREIFAHRYADTLRDKLQRASLIPFDEI